MHQETPLTFDVPSGDPFQEVKFNLFLPIVLVYALQLNVIRFSISGPNDSKLDLKLKIFVLSSFSLFLEQCI